MLRNYFASELLEAKCEHCRNPSASMTKYLTQAPRVLVLHLKRFLPNLEKQRYEKQHTNVDIPLQIDLKEYLKEAYAACSSVETFARGKPLRPTLPARPLAAEAQGTHDNAGGSMICGRRYCSLDHQQTFLSSDMAPKGKQPWECHYCGKDLRPPPPLPPPSAPPPPQDLDQWGKDGAVFISPPVAVWEVLLDDWTPFESHQAKRLEESLTAQQERCEYEARGQRYVINFRTWEQVNKVTNHCRPIRRRLAEGPAPRPPEELSPTVTGGPIYELRSIVAHDGASPHSGHYVCYARGDTGKWRLYDDSLVKEVEDPQRHLGRKAYILFYVLRGRQAG